MISPARTPVIVGVGQINDRPPDPRDGLNSLDLMEAALKLANHDAGGGWLKALDSLAVVDQISFRELGEVCHPLAKRLGCSPRFCYQTPYAGGDSPIRLLNEAANRIGSGEITAAAVVGGEALRTAASRVSTAGGPDLGAPNATRAVSEKNAPSFRQRYGLTAPVDIYPLYENALRASYGQTLSEGQAESAETWAHMSEVAAETEGAWLRGRISAQTIKTASTDNRPIAFPYLKLMVANSSVNQGAGFIVTSMECALDMGVSQDKLIFVGLGASAHEPHDVLTRDNFKRSVSLETVLEKALQFNRLKRSDLDFVELYSCFPCVPKMARRVLDWPADRPATTFGGLTFGGGPIGNYMSHAVVAMVEKLRQGGEIGLLFANGGFATYNHAIMLSRHRRNSANFPQNFDVQAEADILRGPPVCLAEDYIGPGTIETYTVFYDRTGNVKFGVVVARNPNGERFLAKVPAANKSLITLLTDGKVEPVGLYGEAVPDGHGDMIWRMDSCIARPA